jgi:UDP-N-acetylglucosamine transferase subunit ALG13
VRPGAFACDDAPWRHPSSTGDRRLCRVSYAEVAVVLDVGGRGMYRRVQNLIVDREVVIVAVGGGSVIDAAKVRPPWVVSRSASPRQIA